MSLCICRFVTPSHCVSCGAELCKLSAASCCILKAGRSDCGHSPGLKTQFRFAQQKECNIMQCSIPSVTKLESFSFCQTHEKKKQFLMNIFFARNSGETSASRALKLQSDVLCQTFLIRSAPCRFGREIFFSRPLCSPL